MCMPALCFVPLHSRNKFEGDKKDINTNGKEGTITTNYELYCKLYTLLVVQGYGDNDDNYNGSVTWQMNKGVANIPWFVNIGFHLILM